MYIYHLISGLGVGRHLSKLENENEMWYIFWGEVGKEYSILPVVLVPSILIMKYNITWSIKQVLFVNFCESPVKQIPCAELLL